MTNEIRDVKAFSDKRAPLTEPPPPVEARPCCPGCGKRLQPDIDDVREIIERDVEVPSSGWRGDRPSEIKRERAERTVARRWSGRYHAYGFFCTLRCATEFANKQFDRPGMKRPGVNR